MSRLRSARPDLSASRSRFMRRPAASLATLAGIVALGCAESPSAKVPATPVEATSAKKAPVSAAVVRVEGDHIVGPDGKPLVLKGVAFGNRVWNDERIPLTDHDERDYERIADLGMNAVRFYMNYKTFESDEAPGKWLADGFRWLDDNVAWAKRHGVYLILNMHFPPGGYQSLGGGKALWSEPKFQTRFIALWRAIAERYVNEPTIAGYDLLNEPVVSSSISQWQTLAERTITGIREIDGNHAIFVERVNAVGADYLENQDRNFFRVHDPNVVYEFHFYKPFHFTHQGAPWVDVAAASGRYPDEKIAEVEWFELTYGTGTFGSPRLPAGDTDWRYYEGQPLTVEDAKLVVGKPALSCSNVGAGTAYFDDLVLERLEGGKAVEAVWRANLTTTRGWYFWEKKPKGTRALAKSGHGDDSSLTISGTVDDANLGADDLRFRPVRGATYRLSGWMRGEHVPAQANCQVRLDFYTSRVPVQTRGKGFLEQELNAYLAWGKREKVPLFLGEFGAIRAAFEADRGGERWTADMLDLLAKNQLSFTYHDYHEDAFGMFFGDKGLPDPNNSNRALIQVFRDRLGRTPASP
jgi:endoglucanase